MQGNVHFMTTPGSKNFVGWKVMHPAINGNCTVRIGDSPDEKHLISMHPLDGSGDEHGSFPCGRAETKFEGKEFRFPKDMVCDQCILQVEWKTELGEQHYCGDVEVIDKVVPECFGQCQNGGICRNGFCACTSDWAGSNCQYPQNDGSGPGFLDTLLPNLKILLVYALLIGVIIGLFYATYMIMKKLD